MSIWGINKHGFFIFSIKNEKKSSHFESLETIFKGQTEWDRAQITCQNAKIKVLIHL